MRERNRLGYNGSIHVEPALTLVSARKTHGCDISASWLRAVQRADAVLRFWLRDRVVPSPDNASTLLLARETAQILFAGGSYKNVADYLRVSLLLHYDLNIRSRQELLALAAHLARAAALEGESTG